MLITTVHCNLFLSSQLVSSIMASLFKLRPSFVYYHFSGILLINISPLLEKLQRSTAFLLLNQSGLVKKVWTKVISLMMMIIWVWSSTVRKDHDDKSTNMDCIPCAILEVTTTVKSIWEAWEENKRIMNLAFFLW